MAKNGAVDRVRVGYVLEPPYTTFVVNEILALRECGVGVTVFNSFRPFPELSAAAEAIRRESHYFPPQYRGTLAAILATLLSRPLAFARVATAIASRRLSWRLLFLCAQYARTVRSLQLTHLHGMYGTTPATIALLTSWLSGVPFSFTCHAYDIFRPNALLSWRARHARFITTVSESNRHYIHQHYPAVPIEKVHVVYLGADVDLWRRGGGEQGVETSEPSVVSVARLTTVKGHVYLLRAIATLRAQGVRCHLTLIGDGELRDDLEKEVAALHLADSVFFRGSLVPESVREEMLRATVFSLPCVADDFGDHDAVPVALMEAMAAGVPVVTTPIGGIPELIEDGISGLLVPEKDPDALAAALGRVLAEPELRATLRRGGRERTERVFNLKHSARAMATLFSADTERTPVEAREAGVDPGSV